MSQVTQRDIAARLGVNVSTVSRALRGDRRISTALRERVEKAARQMGYSPDPAVSALARYRWEKMENQRGLTLAFLSNGPEHERTGFNRLKQAAESSGYRLDLIDLNRVPSISALLRILRTRGVAGVLNYLRTDIPPAFPLDEVCARYPVVNWNCRLPHPICPSVLRDAYHRVADCCDVLAANKTERVVLLLPGDLLHPNELTRQMLAAWKLFQEGRPGWENVVYYSEGNLERTVARIQAARPQAMILANEAMIRELESRQVLAGLESGFVCMNVEEGKPYSGLASTFPLVSRYCIDLIDRMINRRITGRDIAWIQVEVRGEWVPGKTLSGASPGS